MPTVSVAILTYNRTKELRDCLYSLLSQSVKPFEIIVVDNGSYEETEKFLRSISEEFVKAGVAVRHVPGRHPRLITAARNVGLELANSEYVLVCDDDVEFQTDYVERMLEKFEKYPHYTGLQGSTLPHAPRKPEVFRKRVMNAIQRCFFLSRSDGHFQKVLPSGFVTMGAPRPTPEPTDAQWLISNNMMLKKLKTSARFDEAIVGLGLDDVQFGYKLYLSGTAKLGIVGDAKIKDQHGSTRSSDHSRWAGLILYNTYFFFRYVYTGKAFQIYAFVMSRLGLILVNGIVPLFSDSDPKPLLGTLKGLIYSWTKLKTYVQGTAEEVRTTTMRLLGYDRLQPKKPETPKAQVK